MQIKLKIKLLLFLGFFLGQNLYSQNQKEINFDTINNINAFKYRIWEKLEESENALFSDTIKFVENLISAFSKENSHATFKFVCEMYSVFSVVECHTLTHRRKDFAVLAYIHLYILQQRSIVNAKFLYVKFENHEIIGNFFDDSAWKEWGRDLRPIDRFNTIHIRKMYKELYKWIRNIESQGSTVRDKYPFESKYEWVLVH